MTADQSLPLSFSFQAAWELESLFRSIGLDFRILQITPGPLLVRFEINGSVDAPLLTIRCSQGLLFEGSRNPRWTSIALEQSNSLALHRVRGEAVNEQTIHGLNRNITETFFQISPGAHTSIALLDAGELIALAEETGAYRLLETMEAANTLRLSPDKFRRMKALLNLDSTDESFELRQELIQAALLEALDPEIHTVIYDGELSQQSGLMKDLLTWGYANPTQVIKLQDLTRNIFASRSAIVQNCRATFGMGPMALLKQIRLGQVQQALSHADLQRRIGCSTVQSIAAYYGFASRNHFARDYRQLFGESPSATLQLSDAPGIRSQPVSVAHSPQIAIARR